MRGRGREGGRGEGPGIPPRRRHGVPGAATQAGEEPKGGRGAGRPHAGEGRTYRTWRTANRGPTGSPARCFGPGADDAACAASARARGGGARAAVAPAGGLPGSRPRRGRGRRATAPPASGGGRGRPRRLGRRAKCPKTASCCGGTASGRTSCGAPAPFRCGTSARAYGSSHAAVSSGRPGEPAAEPPPAPTVRPPPRAGGVLDVARLLLRQGKNDSVRAVPTNSKPVFSSRAIPVD